MLQGSNSSGMNNNIVCKHIHTVNPIFTQYRKVQIIVLTQILYVAVLSTTMYSQNKLILQATHAWHICTAVHNGFNGATLHKKFTWLIRSN